MFTTTIREFRFGEVKIMLKTILTKKFLLEFLAISSILSVTMWVSMLLSSWLVKLLVNNDVLTLTMIIVPFVLCVSLFCAYVNTKST